MNGTEAKSDVKEALCQLASDAKDLYLPHKVPCLNSMPSALEFYRSYVAANLPVVVRNHITNWPALSKWSPQYLREKLGDQKVTVAVTPNGYADAIQGEHFVMPEERMMRMGDFLDVMERPKSANGIFYVQKQNSNLTEEFATILPDVESELAMGVEVFGRSPDAVNFWMGDGRAVTSMHRDHYENLYCVISGWKKFILLPPTDLPFVPYRTCQAASYKEMPDGNFAIIEDEETGKVPWVDIDPLCPDLERHPDYSLAHPVEVTVHAGELLYLPSLWFHHVQQSHGCIAVNYWYDMEFDIKYNYYKFMEKLVDMAR